LAFRPELDWFAVQRRVRVVPLLGPRARRPSWLPGALADHDDADALRRIVPDIARSQVYVCGPDAWTEAVRVAALAAGVPADRLHTEQFSW
jgi:ferredoxin-NADP reductase